MASISAELSEPADRTGYKPALIVLHTTEAHELPASGLEQLSGSAETATFHVVNDWTGRDARFVADEYRAHATGPFDQVALHLAHLGVPHQSAGALSSCGTLRNGWPTGTHSGASRSRRPPSTGCASTPTLS